MMTISVRSRPRVNGFVRAWRRTWACVWLAGLAASVSFASEVVSAEGPAAAAAAAGRTAPGEWERFVEAECSFNWSGELWREPAKVTVTFTEAETQAAFEAEVEAARREE